MHNAGKGALVVVLGMSSITSAQTGALSAVLSSTTVMPNEPVSIVLSAEWQVPGWKAIAALDTTFHASVGAYTFLKSGLDPALSIVSGHGTPELHLRVGSHPPISTASNPNPIVVAVLAWSCDTPGVYDLSTATQSMTIYIDTLGTTVSVMPTEFSAQITVVPAPAGIAPLLMCGVCASRRRRYTTAFVPAPVRHRVHVMNVSQPPVIHDEDEPRMPMMGLPR